MLGWIFFYHSYITLSSLELCWTPEAVQSVIYVVRYHSFIHSVSKCMTSLCCLRWATANVHLWLPQLYTSFIPFFFFLDPRTEIMRRKISCLHQPQIGEMKICLKQRERPPWRLGLQFLSHIPWRFHVTKHRKLLCPSSCHVTPLTHSFFSPSCCLAVCAVSP